MTYLSSLVRPGITQDYLIGINCKLNDFRKIYVSLFLELNHPCTTYILLAVIQDEGLGFKKNSYAYLYKDKQNES